MKDKIEKLQRDRDIASRQHTYLQGQIAAYSSMAEAATKGLNFNEKCAKEQLERIQKIDAVLDFLKENNLDAEPSIVTPS